MLSKKSKWMYCAMVISFSLLMPIHVQAKGTPTITYNGSSKQFRLENVSGMDLFTDLKGLMPGDEVKQKITIKTKDLEKETSLYLEADSKDEKEILENMMFFVEKDGKVISRNVAFEPINLGKYQGDDTTTLTVNLQIPIEKELSNKEYHVEWSIIAQEDGKEITKEPIKTGDESHIIWYLGLMLLSLLCVIGLIRHKKDKV